MTNHQRSTTFWLRASTMGLAIGCCLLPISCNGGSGGGGGSGTKSTISSETVAHNVPTRSLTKDLQVQAAYNTTDGLFFWKFSWLGNAGKWHDYHTFTGGAWKTVGEGFRNAPSTDDLVSAETRITIMMNDPSAVNAVPNFGLYGCFLACHDDAQHMLDWAQDGRTDEVTMGLPWAAIDPDGVYTGSQLDLWHWRGHRSNHTEGSDDQYVNTDPPGAPGAGGGGRHSDAGTGPYSTKSLVSGLPQFTLDPADTGGAFAFKMADLKTTPYYFFTNVVGFPPAAMDWATATGTPNNYVPTEGDTVPRRLLRATTGSRSDISAVVGTTQKSTYDSTAGRWDVFLTRALDTTNTEDVVLVDGQTVELAFGLFTDEAFGRDHYVSFPQTLGLNVFGMDIVAVPLTGVGIVPDFSDTATYPVKVIECFLPGITSLEYLTSTQTGPFSLGAQHGGFDEVKKALDGTVAATVSCRNCHVVKASDPNAAAATGGALETKVSRRGGVLGHTPVSLKHTVVGVLQGRCFSCHNDTGSAKKFSFGSSAVDATTVYKLVRGIKSTFLDYTDATKSRMLTYPATDVDSNHPATGPLAGFAGSADFARIQGWILYNAPNN